MQISWHNFWKNPEHFLALGCGLGLLPKAPGTWGTLLGIPLVVLMANLNVGYFTLVTLLAFLLGVRVCGKTARDIGVHDHGSIVWDEVLGYMVTMFMIPVSALSLLLAFIFFRIFDIIKPPPISAIDKRVHGGLGIMLDDVLAGVYANICMWIVFSVIQL